MHFTIYGFVYFSGAAEAALLLGGQRLQVLPHLRDARDHPSIIPIHPAHAEHPPVRPAWPRLSRDRLWLCGAPWQCGWRRLEAPHDHLPAKYSLKLGRLGQPAWAGDPALFPRHAGAQRASRERR